MVDLNGGVEWNGGMHEIANHSGRYQFIGLMFVECLLSMIYPKWPSPCESFESNDCCHGAHTGTKTFCSS